MRNILTICIVLFLFTSSASATSIVAVKNNDEIVIGADSKTTFTPLCDSAGEQGSIEKCKIVQTGNLFFASAGSAGMGKAAFRGNVDPEFNVKEVISKGLGGQGRVTSKIANLEKVLVADLTRIVEEARQENAAFFLERFSTYPMHTIIVVGSDNGELVLIVRTFRPILSRSGSLSFEIRRFDCPGDCQESFITVFGGQTEAIRNYLQENEYFLSSTDPVTAVRDLVELEISKDPSFVGPPVDILRLTKNGAEWVQRKSLCPDIQNSPVLPDEK
jgi:hypothetical protein